MLENNIRHTIEIIDANGNVIATSGIPKEVPGFAEFDQHGFAKVFDEYEKAALEKTKATLSDVTEKYVVDMSKKVIIQYRSLTCRTKTQLKNKISSNIIENSIAK